MAPRSSRASGADTDTSMADEPIRQLPVDPMVSSTKSLTLFELSQNFWNYYLTLRGRVYRHGPLTFTYRMSTRLQILQKTPIPIRTPPPAVLSVNLSTPTGANDVPRQPNSVEVFLERNMIFLANQRYVPEYLPAHGLAGTISDILPGR
jgi:hypothetical protein